MAKRLALAFLAGMAMNLLLALYLGGETLTQAGIRLSAIEQGFHLAGRHWQWEANPQLVQAEPLPQATAARRRK